MLFRRTRFWTGFCHRSWNERRSRTVWPWIDFANLSYLLVHYMWQRDWEHRLTALCSDVPLLKPMRKGCADACLIACRASFMASKMGHITYPLWSAWWWQQQPAPCPLKLHRGIHIQRVYLRSCIQYKTWRHYPHIHIESMAKKLSHVILTCMK